MKSAHTSRPAAEILLITVALFWGATFPLVKDAVSEVPVLCFLWVRFVLAALLLAAFAGPRLLTLDHRGLLRGIFLGAILFVAYAFQTFGLEITSSANAGFLTGLNVIWIPLLAGPLLGKPAGRGAWVGVTIALFGLLLLTWHSPWALNRGDLLVAVSSVFIAFHILGLDKWTAGYDGRALAFVQIATMALLGFLGSLIWEPVTWPRHWSGTLLIALIITAVFATVYAFWILTTFQRLTTPTRAALIYALEPVFAAIFSVWLAGDRLTSLAWIGGGLIVAGMLLGVLLSSPTVAASWRQFVRRSF